MRTHLPSRPAALVPDRGASCACRRLAPLVLLILASVASRALSAEAPREMRVLDLHFLGREPRTAGSIPGAPAIRGRGIRGWDRDAFAGFAGPGWDLPTDADLTPPGRSLLVSPAQVAGAIRLLVDEDSWANARNRIEAQPGRLVVVQSPAVLDRIERLLRRLEARAARRASLDIAIVPATALDAAAPGWRRPGSSPWLPAEALDRAVAESAGAAVLFSGPFREGERARIRPRKLSQRVEDVEVNCTGVTPVLNPWVSSMPEGDYAEVVIIASPSGGWYRADLRVGSTSIVGPVEVRTLGIAEIDLLAARDVRLETSLVLPRGKTAVAGVFVPAPRGDGAADAPRAAGFAVLVRAAPIEALSQPAAEAADLPLDLDLGVLAHGLTTFRIPADVTQDSGAGAGAIVDLGIDAGDAAPPIVYPDFMEALIRSALPSEARETAKVWSSGGTALIGAPGLNAAEVRGRLDGEARSRLRPVQVDLWQGTVPVGDLIGLGAGGAVLDDGWLARLQDASGLRARVVSISGAGSALASVVARNYVRDLERLSGGTGTEVVEVSDPEIRRAGEGLVLDLLPSLVPETPWAQVKVEGELARPPRFERTARSRSASTLEIQPGAKSGEDVRATGEWVQVDLPDEDSDRWEHAVTVPLGHPFLLGALPDAAQPGRTRILIVVVSAFDVEPPAAR